ncbi:pyridoxamine 5'-phosphate oxidase [Aggregatibacter actinomycetemcomitans]|uniref:pyridoxamine 5'-phosphate oxidase n=1 Tax=Aggregatibacter actinomycetemcomitans TaxID=714 RepID=UPI0001B9F55C|nr:pyridoxamine 5'-phosphate oxidase [Aggregatibacter actinomycetemcomitans]AEW76521.1 pyridoxamine 5'-phosphate oxidase [Aggregatibacter actinomycetemcomitans ANH9381]ACX81591.1 pyridoxamine 5'-phosphate oxidase [Aggregatibacter actinomycetemcomitans D11S-1]AHN71068.1 pyridoxamine 5'-phosphate oxidase, putative [Aggregatibacter actinomycetemcomitans HK1651]AMQ92902.1 pyridoxamine 5'-phosphate oxidase [Aggregatibacter actinomycetemcomitans]KND82317.1 pyridoxamine 5'-phosphate oxidase [Aggregat
MDLHNIRAEYRKKVLSQLECHANPITQFEHWLDDAINAQVNEPTAMNLATVNENGRPSSRMVLLKEVNVQGFVFFTNYHSRKGRAIEQQPYVALTFFWPELERSVRIEGKAEKISAEQSDAYFASRPYTSRIGAWASEQSAVISGYKSLLAKAALIAAQHPLNVPRPESWGGYLVTPDRIEFWQGRPSRLHDRICYLLENGEWKNVRLSP